jgi:hypothetical protein
MKRLLTLFSLFCLLAVLAVPVFAQASGAPSDDTFVRASEPGTNFNGTDLSSAGSTIACNATDTIFLQWDLSAITPGRTIGTATLTLTTKAVLGLQGGTTLTLYQVTNDAWDETTLTSATAPALGAAIQTVSPVAAPNPVSFSGANLISYLQAQADGDNAASFAVRVTGACAAGVTFVQFEDKESAANGPDLDMQDPTAVTITGLTASALSDGRLALALAGVVSAGLILVIVLRRRRSANEA